MPLRSPEPTDAEAIALLHDLVAIPSLSGAEQAAVSYLVDAMQRLGLEAHIDETGNAVGSIGQGRPEIVLLGHIDTVAGDVPVRVQEGRLYGRGAVDAKGPLAAFVMALARLRAGGMVPGRITVIGCVEEEAPSSRGAHGAIRRYQPDFCIVGEPSGADTITLGYKGSLRVRLRLSQPCGHSAHNRHTAAEHGLAAWQTIGGWAQELNTSRTRAWDQLLPALIAIRSGTDGIAEWCDLDLSLRLPPGLSPAEAGSRLAALVPGSEITVLGSVPAFSAPRSSPVVRALIAGIRGEKETPRFVVKMGTSDMNLAGPAWNCPIATYGPGDSNLDHTPEEHIVLAEYLRAIRVLEAALRLLCQTQAGHLLWPCREGCHSGRERTW